MTDAASIETFCPDCGYDLRASESARCPECGWVIDREAMGVSRIPWSHRAGLGRARAFWRTVWLATWSIKRLTGEVVRPVDERDARRFAGRVALVAGVLPALGLLVAFVLRGGTDLVNPLPDPGMSLEILPPAADLVVPYVAGITRWPVVPLGIVLTLWLIVRAGRLGFVGIMMPPERRRRGEAVGLYASGPWAFLGLAFVLMLAGVGIEVGMSDPLMLQVGRLLLIAGWAVAAFILAWNWVNVLRVLRRTAQATVLRLATVAVALPVVWAACAVLALGAVPWVVGLLWLMVDSLAGN